MIRHPVLDNQKYSRILRLMRLSATKDWLLSIAEKRGMRVHTTNAAYTSQECPSCHHVDRKNRPSQAVFHCVECSFQGDADQVAGTNIAQRSKEPLRSRLHAVDRYGRCSPKVIQRSVLKTLLLAQKSG
jgi:transposase